MVDAKSCVAADTTSEKRTQRSPHVPKGSKILRPLTFEQAALTSIYLVQMKVLVLPFPNHY